MILKWYHTLQVKFDLLVKFLIFLAVYLSISTVINLKILTNSNQQIQSYKFTSYIAAFFLCGFDHRDAWIMHTNIIWSKRSTEFKELSPCSVWYPLKGDYSLWFWSPRCLKYPYKHHMIKTFNWFKELPPCSVWYHLKSLGVSKAKDLNRIAWEQLIFVSIVWILLITNTHIYLINKNTCINESYLWLVAYVCYVC